jgi:hypothetical protein
MTAPDDLSPLREKSFAEAVSKLEELMAQSGRAFLIGAGCSKCAGLPLTAELTEKALTSTALDGTTKGVLEALKNRFAGGINANIEDFLSEFIDLLAIADRRTARGATQKLVELGGASYAADQLRSAAEQIKRGIVEVIDANVSIDTHQHFVKAVHRVLRPGKAMPDQPVDYLVLNYDTLVEDALALERLPFSDGLDGGVTGWWSPSTFERAGLAGRVLKLHGSINWCEFPGDPLPRRVGNSLQVARANERRILIWPASTKYRETQLDPFAQLAERSRQVLRPRRGSQCVLIVCGYGFGDSHINLEINRALRESEGRLTVVAFTSENVPSGQLKMWNEDSSVHEQVLVFAKRGFFHGREVAPAITDLPWWKFENIARLLGGER